MEFKKGNKYRCVESLSPSFTDGHDYTCEEDGSLTSDDGRKVKIFDSTFTLVEQQPDLNDILKRVEKLETALMLSEPVKESKPESEDEEVIYVPEGILDCNGYIINGNQILWGDEDGWNVYSQSKIFPSSPTQFKLEKCNREDLKVGEIAFRTDSDKPKTNNRSKYCVVLDVGYQFWAANDAVKGDLTWKHWYRTVEA